MGALQAEIGEKTARMGEVQREAATNNEALQVRKHA